MGLCVIRYEIAASLGYETAEDLQMTLNKESRARRLGRGKAGGESSGTIGGESTSPTIEESSKTSTDGVEVSASTSNGSSPNRKMALRWFNTANDVLANTESAVEVLSDYLNYDKVQSNTLTLELTKVPIWSVIEVTMDEFRLPALNKDIQFSIDFRDCRQEDQFNEKEEVVYNRANDLPIDMLTQQIVVGDEIRIQQVLRNLASNAVKFCNDGGTISIRASCLPLSGASRDSSAKKKNLSATATATRDDKERTRTSRIKPKTVELKDGKQISVVRSGCLEVVVEDSGVGMSQDQLEKVCSAGVQFNVNELQSGKGSGLGMYISKGIVEQHDGKLEAASPGLGKGSKFTITIPLFNCITGNDDDDTVPVLPSSLQGGEEQDVEAGLANVPKTVVSKATPNIATAASASSSSAGAVSDAPKSNNNKKKALKVLIVDDILSNRKLLGRLLNINGHSFDEAEDGSIAVAKVQEALEVGSMYDTILLDHEMPVMNGPDAAKKIKKMCPGINIVGITGNMLRDDVELFKASGADEVMGKPFKMQVLNAIWERFGVL